MGGEQITHPRIDQNPRTSSHRLTFSTKILRGRFTHSDLSGRTSSRELLFEGDERPVDVPLVDTVDVAGFVRDPPPLGLVVPPLLAPAQLARALLRRCDGHAHTRLNGTGEQKDTGDRRPPTARGDPV